MAIEDERLRLIEGGTDEFLAALEGIDKELAREIIKIYAKFVVGKELVLNAEELAQLDAAIVAAVRNTNYSDLLDVYLPNFDKLQELNKRLHRELNDLDPSDVLAENDKIINHTNVVKSRLQGTPSTIIRVTDVVDGEKVVRQTPIRNASLDELVDPIADMIRQDVIIGTTFEAATETILEAIENKHLGLTKWAGQIARDALNQSDGIQQQAIKEEFGLKYVSYQGTIKDTTRPFCYHLLSGGENVFTEDQIAKALDSYCPEGVPSKSETTKTPSGKSKEKGSGMIPGTVLENFTVYRGGYNCRHLAVWKRRK